ncbi:MAG TPA: hypothetical protein VFW65_12740 [Pseudonocardiaceae bacterium]|nr:hypothetical protein [Pseudonocardiaceae bacterium]
MTSTATQATPHVVSAISGGAFRPWYYATTPDQQRKIITELLGETAGHVFFYVWDRPAGGKDRQYPDQQFKVVYNHDYGAAHYTNGDPAHGPVGAWLAVADDPPADPAPVAYDPWDPARVTLTPDVLLPIVQLQRLAIEYATTGQRPVGAQWKAVDFV